MVFSVLHWKVSIGKPANLQVTTAVEIARRNSFLVLLPPWDRHCLSYLPAEDAL